MSLEIWDNDLYVWGGIHTPPASFAVLAVEASYFAYSPFDLLDRYGLPNGLPSEGKESVLPFFTEVRRIVHTLHSFGLVDLHAPLMSSPPTRRDLDLAIQAINNTLASNNPVIVSALGRYAPSVRGKTSLGDWVYRGLYEIVTADSPLDIGRCGFRGCQKFYEKPTKRSEFCCDSHRIREAKARKEFAK